MIKRIIVAYDGSDLAREAFAYAVQIAEAAGVEVFGLHAIEPTPAPIMIADPIVGFDPTPIVTRIETEADRRAKALERKEAERDFADLQQYCEKRNVVFRSAIEDGPLLDRLLNDADPTDLIAVGAAGRFARHGLGSFTKEIVKNGPCPLLIVSGPLRQVGRILTAYDGSGASERAVAWAIAAAAQTSWPLTVLAVSTKKLSLDDALAKAQELAPRAQVVHEGPENQSKTQQIERIADHAKHAMLAFGAYTDSWLHQLFFGGTTGKVLAEVQAPVVLVR